MQRRHVKLLLSVLVAGGLVYLVMACAEGIRYQMSGFYGDFGDLVNRNLLGSWEAREPRELSGSNWCAPGSEPDWPSTRSQCSFLGGAVDGCSILTYGRSCAVIGVPKIYFDDPHFREALRVALSDLCAVFRRDDLHPLRRRMGTAHLYYSLGCDSGRAASLSVLIHVYDRKIEPPYRILIPDQGGFPKRTALANFSAWTQRITVLSETPE